MKKKKIFSVLCVLTMLVGFTSYRYFQQEKNSLAKDQEMIYSSKYKGVTIKNKARGKVSKEQVEELKKDHSNKNEKNLIIWEAKEAGE